MDSSVSEENVYLDTNIGTLEIHCLFQEDIDLHV